MYCSILYRTGKWTRTVKDLFQQTFHEITLEFVLMKYHVASKGFVPQGFGVLCGRLIWRPGELHHFGVCFCDYVVRCVCLEQVVDSPTVQSYFAVLLTLMGFQFKCSERVECKCRGMLHKDMSQPKSRSFRYLIRITPAFEDRQKSESRNQCQMNRIFESSSVPADT